MNNYVVSIECLAEGKKGTRDEWRGVASNDTNAEATALIALAKKLSVKESELTILICRKV